MNPADLWELLTKHGIKPDSATDIVRSHGKMNDADLWERLVKNGASETGATDIVKARGGPPDTSVSARNLGRAFGQGATFHWSDELSKLVGLPEAAQPDMAKQAAFAKEHRFVNAATQAAGMALAPAAAVAALPELATAGGAAAIGGLTGLLSGAGEGTDLESRAHNAALEGAAGAAFGPVGHAIGKGVGAVVGAVAKRLNPARGVAEGAKDLLTPEVGARMAEVNKIAPGGSSIASAAVPAEGRETSRFLTMVRGLGANPKTAAIAEGTVMNQRAVLGTALDDLGRQMDGLAGEVPVTPKLRDALGKVRGVIGARTPNAPAAAAAAGDNPLGIEMSVPFSFDPEAKTVPVQDLRGALSRLRFILREAEKHGMDANGATTHEAAVAKNALQDVLYEHAPGFATLDKKYATIANELRSTDHLLETTQLSRANYAGNQAYGASAGSLGGSLPKGAHSATVKLIDKLFVNKAGAADAVQSFIMKPGGPEIIDKLLEHLPADHRVTKAIAKGISASLVPAARGLLFPAQDEQP